MGGTDTRSGEEAPMRADDPLETRIDVVCARVREHAGRLDTLEARQRAHADDVAAGAAAFGRLEGQVQGLIASSQHLSTTVTVRLAELRDVGAAQSAEVHGLARAFSEHVRERTESAERAAQEEIERHRARMALLLRIATAVGVLAALAAGILWGGDHQPAIDQITHQEPHP